ncbi:hypothetical protein ACHAXT_008091 [Thalassiosira profunda]
MPPSTLPSNSRSPSRSGGPAALRGGGKGRRSGGGTPSQRQAHEELLAGRPGFGSRHLPPPVVNDPRNAPQVVHNPDASANRPSKVHSPHMMNPHGFPGQGVPAGAAPSTAELDATIRDLSRRRAMMAQQAAAAANAMGGMGGGPTNGDGSKGSIDSSAQAFVDRFASAHAKDPGPPLGDGSYHSLASGGGAQRRGSSGDNDGKQWLVCDHCSSKAFVSKKELVAHEETCELNAANKGAAAPGGLSRGGSLGSSDHSMGRPGAAMPGAPMPLGFMHPMMMMHPGMNPYYGMMMCGDASGMMGMPYGMPGSAMAVDDVVKGSHRKRKSTAPTPELVEASKGPFRSLPKPVALALADDKDWLTPLHCFVRKNCVEVFTATGTDVQTPSKGKRKPIQVGQVGIRCPHCHAGRSDSDPNRERGSVYYPSSLGSIYNATMNLLQRHLHSCPKVPKAIMERYAELKKDDARSGTSKKYWIESAKSLGFVDTLHGIKLSDAPAPTLPSARMMGERMEKAVKEEMGAKESGDRKRSGGPKGDTKKKARGEKAKGGGAKKDGEEEEKKEDPLSDAPPLVIPADKNTATAFSFCLLSQMQPCVFTEADRLGKRKGLPTGFAGLACRHCFGGYGSGRFFPSSIKTLSDTSKTLTVLHNHMARCRKVPPGVLEELETARATHDEERSKMKFGSQKAFFAKIWSRLHDNRPDGVIVRPPPRQPSNANPDGGTSRKRFSVPGPAMMHPVPAMGAHMMPMPMDHGQMMAQMVYTPMMPMAFGGGPHPMAGMPPGGPGDTRRPLEAADETTPRKRAKRPPNAEV